MRSSLFYFGLAVLCFTQLFIAAVVADGTVDVSKTIVEATPKDGTLATCEAIGDKLNVLNALDLSSVLGINFEHILIYIFCLHFIDL
jgi:hypothetical protein